ncbi:MAG: amino acid ABC transporter ATP-binding protein [Clostridia bacterium]|nr:amino acid ABC transporter ATP-binding protein [Clostridia bacterium]MBR2735074.1 amino acid ABC transporter ATP-binding protein [Clostridia bacterium]
MISVKDLYKEYKQDDKVLHVLNGISTDFKKGEKVAIIGPSGSGKSTFLRCINALETPTSGEIFFKDKKVDAQSRDIDSIRQKIGMVFQHFNLFPHMTILENITFAPITLKIYQPSQAKELGLALLEKVGLKDKWNVHPSRLSGGQKQRVAIVRALMMNPEVMLFDEPTSALDPEVVKDVIELMVDIAKSGMTMIMVTHEMNFVRRAATRVLFMDEGKIISDTTPEDFFGNCENVRISKFLNKLT